jgi:hypothetical protein
MHEIVIRPANENDLDGLLALHHELAEGDPAKMPADPDQYQRVLKAILTDPARHLHVAVMGTRVVGSATGARPGRRGGGPLLRRAGPRPAGGYRYGEAQILRWLGVARLEQGRAAEAMALTLDSIDLFRQLGSRGGEAMALRLRGELDLGQGRLGPARAALTQCLLIAEEAGDVAAQSGARQLLGRLCVSLFRQQDARGKCLSNW